MLCMILNKQMHLTDGGGECISNGLTHRKSPAPNSYKTIPEKRIKECSSAIAKDDFSKP